MDTGRSSTGEQQEQQQSQCRRQKGPGRDSLVFHFLPVDAQLSKLAYNALLALRTGGDALVALLQAGLVLCQAGCGRLMLSRAISHLLAHLSHLLFQPCSQQRI